LNATLGQVMERNVLYVSGERDSERRKSVINELYSESCTFFEADDQIVGRDALSAKVEQILKGAPGFVFRLAGPAEVNHDLGPTRWHFGTNGAAPVVTGWMLRSSKKEEFARCMPFSTRLLAISGTTRPLKKQV
jgi:hypothetical protein